MLVFRKVLDQLIRATFLETNAIIVSSKDFNRNFFLDNLIIAVSVSM